MCDHSNTFYCLPLFPGTDEQTLYKPSICASDVDLINPIPVSPISSLPKISQNFFLVSRTASSPW